MLFTEWPCIVEAASSAIQQNGRDQSMFPHISSRAIAIGVTAIAIGAGTYGLVNATASTDSGSSSPASSASTTSAPGLSGNRDSNARSGPAAGGSIGEVSSLSKSGFELSTSTGQKVAVKETSTTSYQRRTDAASSRVVRKGEAALVLGTVDSATITATHIIVEPTHSVPTSSSGVTPFERGAPSTSTQVGQVPASYKQGTGSIVSGTAADTATKAALAAYPGGIVDRVVKLSNGEYEVHNIGVNWPHHIFVNHSFKVVGAD